MKMKNLNRGVLIAVFFACFLGCGCSNQALEEKSVTLEGTFCVGMYDQDDTVTIDFGEQKKIFEGTTVESATIDGNEFVKCSYEDGKLTLDNATIPGLGEKTVQAVFKGKGVAITAKISVDVYTMVINDEQELNRMPLVIREGNPSGHFILGNDVVCGGTYNSGNTEPFSGTFDGRGYAIYNLKTEENDENTRGLFGLELTTAVIKNVSFVNAKHSGEGGFIASRGGGSFENVYFEIEITNPSRERFKEATAVLVGDALAQLRVKNVFIDYINPLSQNAPTGYPVYCVWHGYGSYQGLYVVGADKIAPLEGNSDVGEDDYAVYLTMDAFRDAEKDFSAWDPSFWTVQDGLPIPKNLVDK